MLHASSNCGWMESSWLCLASVRPAWTTGSNWHRQWHYCHKVAW
jgi:hypothetical protein